MNTLGDYLLTKSWSNMIFEFFNDDSFNKNINKKYRKNSLDFRNYEDLKIFLLKTFGDFGSLNLDSLDGCPDEIFSNFNCSVNNLTSLIGAPKEVSGNFYCSYNRLTSLEGAPKEIGGDFWCSYNRLTSLEGAPKEVGGDFDCSYNKLTSLEGAPWKVGGYFNYFYNQNLPDYKIKAYKAYLKLFDSKKAPLTKDGHYYPTEEWENKFK